MAPTLTEYKKMGLHVYLTKTLNQDEYLYILPQFRKKKTITLTYGKHYFRSIQQLHERFPNAEDIVNVDVDKLIALPSPYKEKQGKRKRVRPKRLDEDEDSTDDLPKSTESTKITKTSINQEADNTPKEKQEEVKSKLASSSKLDISLSKNTETTTSASSKYCDMEGCEYDLSKKYDCEGTNCSSKVHDICVGLLFGHADDGKFCCVDCHDRKVKGISKTIEAKSSIESCEKRKTSTRTPKGKSSSVSKSIAEWNSPPMIGNPQPCNNIDIYGLSSNTLGRTCATHETCGDSIALNDILVLREEVVRMDEGTLVSVVKAYKVIEGSQVCAVGFLPKSLFRTKNLYINKFCQVVEDLRISSNTMELRRNARYRGIVKAKLLDNIDEHFRQ